MSEWQPIESAPKNGRSVLLYEQWISGQPSIFVGHYANGWVLPCYFGNDDLIDVNPTHWQPLPEPPK